MRTTFATLLTLLLPATTCLADSPRLNEPIVAAGTDGSCYAKSIPGDITGQRGRTTIYNVREAEDVPTATYDWYSTKIYLECNAWRDGRSETTVVHMGPWAEGHHANESDLALAFYVDGKLVKRYSTLDIAGEPTNVGGSVSHYVVFASVDGFQWQEDGSLDFIATRRDGIRLRFSSATGQLVQEKP